MGFWKKLGIWNMFTGETPETRALGALVALDDYEKEQETKNKKIIPNKIIVGLNAFIVIL